MLDDETGEPLYQRADDTAEALKTRLVHWVGHCAAGEKEIFNWTVLLAIGMLFRSLHDGN